MKSYVLFSSVLPVTKGKLGRMSDYTRSWVAVHNDLLYISNAAKALLSVGTYGVEIRPLVNGILGEPIADVSTYLHLEAIRQAREEHAKAMAEA